MIQNSASVTIAVSVSIGKNRLNAEIAFHIAVKTHGQLKNLFDAAVSSRISHILNHWLCGLMSTTRISYEHMNVVIKGNLSKKYAKCWNHVLPLSHFVCSLFL